MARYTTRRRDEGRARARATSAPSTSSAWRPSWPACTPRPCASTSARACSARRARRGTPGGTAGRHRAPAGDPGAHPRGRAEPGRGEAHRRAPRRGRPAAPPGGRSAMRSSLIAARSRCPAAARGRSCRCGAVFPARGRPGRTRLAGDRVTLRPTTTTRRRSSSRPGADAEWFAAPRGARAEELAERVRDASGGSGSFSEGAVILAIEAGRAARRRGAERQPVTAFPPGVFELGIEVFEAGDRGQGLGGRGAGR